MKVNLWFTQKDILRQKKIISYFVQLDCYNIYYKLSYNILIKKKLHFLESFSMLFPFANLSSFSPPVL